MAFQQKASEPHSRILSTTSNHADVPHVAYQKGQTAPFKWSAAGTGGSQGDVESLMFKQE